MTDYRTSPIVRFANAMPPRNCCSHAARGMELALETFDSIGSPRNPARDQAIRAVHLGLQRSPPLGPINDPVIRKALTTAAEIFVDEVWPVVFKSAKPSEARRRRAITDSITDYTTAFARSPQPCLHPRVCRRDLVTFY